jgi:hypothetical protein
MAEILFPEVDPITGKINIAVIPMLPYASTAQGAKADTALQSADMAPVAFSGSYADLLNKPSSGPQQFTWHFPGSLLVRSGMAFIVFPSTAIYPGKHIHLLHATAILGTMTAPSTDATANTAAALLVNRAVLQALTIPYNYSGGLIEVSLSALAGSQLNAGDVLSVDITQVPTLPRTTQAGDLTVTVWWEWV